MPTFAIGTNVTRRKTHVDAGVLTAPPHQLSATAATLLALLELRPRSWTEMRAAGLPAALVFDLVAELKACGLRLHVGLDEVELVQPVERPLVARLARRLLWGCARRTRTIGGGTGE